MFDLGLQELIVIFVVALLVFGPKRLPELARVIGKTVGQFRSVISDVKREVEKEMHMAETGLDLKELPAWKNKFEAPVGQPPAEEESADKKQSDNVEEAEKKDV